MDGYDPYSLVWMKQYVHELNSGAFALNAPTGDVLAVTVARGGELRDDRATLRCAATDAADLGKHGPVP